MITLTFKLNVDNQTGRDLDASMSEAGKLELLLRNFLMDRVDENHRCLEETNLSRERRKHLQESVGRKYRLLAQIDSVFEDIHYLDKS